MTRRRNPPPRRPGPGRPVGKDKEQNVDNDLRVARAVRKAESLQKQRLRRGDWDTDYDDADEPLEAGFDAELEDSPEGGGDGLEEEQE